MKLVFVGKRDEQDRAASFSFEPEEPVTWIAGQSIRLEIPAEYGTQEHRFTISAAPFEKNITITTRLTGSDYKNQLLALQPGDEIQGHAISGKFIWIDSTMPLVFAAGGIGITPYHSILTQRVQDGLPIPVHLVYSNSSDDFVFGKELQTYADDHPEFKMTWLPSQRLTVDAMLKNIPDLTKSLVFVSGPEAMVNAVSDELLNDVKLSEEQLVLDQFSGYQGYVKGN